MFQHYKNSEYKKGTTKIFGVSLCKVFILTCLRIASVKAETCSTHVKIN